MLEEQPLYVIHMLKQLFGKTRSVHVQPFCFSICSMRLFDVSKTVLE